MRYKTLLECTVMITQSCIVDILLNFSKKKKKLYLQLEQNF